jgi:hypothetical protein
MTQTWTRVSSYHNLMEVLQWHKTYLKNTHVFPQKSPFSLVSHYNLPPSLFTGFRAWIRPWWKSKLNFNLQSQCDGRKEEKREVTPFPVRMLLRVYIVLFRCLGYDSINHAARSDCNRLVRSGTASLRGVASAHCSDYSGTSRLQQKSLCVS